MHLFYCDKTYFPSLTIAFFHLVWTTWLLYIFFDPLFWSFSYWNYLSAASCVIFTKDPCNVLPSFWSRHSTLLFPIGSLTIHFCYYVVWNTFFESFSIAFSMELPYSSGVAIVHMFPATFFHFLQVNNRLYYFLLSNCWPILTIMLCVDCHTFFPLEFLSFSQFYFFNSSTVTITKSTCNAFPSFLSVHSTLLLLSFITHSHNYVLWTAKYFFCLFFTHYSVEVFRSSCVTVT